MFAAALPTSLREKGNALGAKLLARLGDGHIKSVLTGAVMVMGIRVGGAAIALLSQIFLARWMGAFEYGIYAYVWVWVITLGIVAPMGFTTAILRFIPEYRTKEKWHRLRGVLNTSWRMVLMFGLLCMALGFAVLALIQNHIDAYYITPLIVALLTVPVIALADCQEGMARGFGWINLAYLPSYILRPLFIVAAAWGIYYFAGTPTGLQVTIAALAGALLIVIWQRLVLASRIRKIVPVSRPVYHTAYWTSVAAPLVLVEGLYLMLTNTDIFILGQFVAPDQVGVYYASTRIANLIVFIYFAVAALAVPKFAELHAAGSRSELQRFTHGIIQWIFWPSVAGALFLLVVGGFALELFGEGFSSGFPVLCILMLGFLVRASTGPIEYLLNMTGHQKATAIAYGGAALLNILLNFVLIPECGIIGAASATAISISVATLWLVVEVRRRLGVTAFVFARGGMISEKSV